MENRRLIKSIKIARKNWIDWKVVYEHIGPKNENPLITDPKLFKKFCREYSVNRTIRKDTHDQLRSKLVESPELLFRALQYENGEGLDKLEEELKPNFGAQDGKRGLISVLSKVAAFLKPEVFVAWDQFGKKGVKKALSLKDSFRFNYYSDYLKAFEEAWINEPGKEIRDYVVTNGGQFDVESEPRFQRRVLDVSLMDLGGRWKN